MSHSKAKRESVRVQTGELKDLLKELELKKKDFMKQGFKKISYEWNQEYGELELFSSRSLTKTEERLLQKQMLEHELANLRLKLVDRKFLVANSIKKHSKSLKIYELAKESKKASSKVQSDYLELLTEVEYLKELNRRINACLNNKKSTVQHCKKLLAVKL